MVCLHGSGTAETGLTSLRFGLRCIDRRSTPHDRTVHQEGSEMTDHRLALVVGANRGIGLGVTKEFLAHGWDVIATARNPAKATALHALEAKHPGRVSIPALDMADPEAVDDFAGTLGGKKLDAVLVNAGVSGPEHRSASAATEAETGALMFTNAIAPIRLARSLAGRAPACWPSPPPSWAAWPRTPAATNSIAPARPP
jgi:NAD(P)-dependent dehydrogenase (short-subunit alcohol dehydrogenase family)